MSDTGAEHWKSWVTYDWVPSVEQTEITVSMFDDIEPTEDEIEALIEEMDLDCGCCQCEPLFQEWFEENQEVIEEDFDGLDYTQKLLIKDWLMQAFDAGAGR